MQRVASVKGVLQEKKDVDDDDAQRSPECVWTEEADGAWAAGKAPVQLLTALLRHVQDGDVAEAELSARAILEVEPQNQLVQDLLSAMKLQEQMEAELESESESDGSESDDDDDDESEGDESESEAEDATEERDDEASAPQGSEEKNNEEK